MINLLKSLEMFIKKIFVKRIFLNPFKTQFEIKAPRGTGKTTACVKFAKRMMRKNRTVIWILPTLRDKYIITNFFNKKYNVKIIYFVEQGNERYISDILYSRQMIGKSKFIKGSKIAFVIDNELLLRNLWIPQFIKKFCLQYNIPYIFTRDYRGKEGVKITFDEFQEFCLKENE